MHNTSLLTVLTIAVRKKGKRREREEKYQPLGHTGLEAGVG